MPSHTRTSPYVKGELVSIRELSEHYQKADPGIVLPSGFVIDVEDEVVTVRIGGDLNKFAPRESDGVYERLLLPNRTMMHHPSLHLTGE